MKRHLPEWPDFPGPIRVKHLVYMTSCLPEYFSRGPAGEAGDIDYFTVDEAIANVLLVVLSNLGTGRTGDHAQ